MARYAQAPSDLNAEVRQLKDELYMTRHKVVRLAPDEFHDLLESHFSCKTRSESYHWVNDVAEKIIERAVPIDVDREFDQRAYCPLCRGGSQSFYSHDGGYSLPEGLRRHLTGYGRTHECPVMECARKLAQEHWNSEFAPQEATSNAKRARERAARLQTETSYLVGPTDEPVLLGDTLWRPARSDDDADFSLKWAEQRLFSLGFRINVDGLRRSYTQVFKHDDSEYMVYADPRQRGEISFRVFDSAVKKSRKKGLPLHHFSIRDTWKNHLRAKIDAAIVAASKSGR